jgi:hypothetical protein
MRLIHLLQVKDHHRTQLSVHESEEVLTRLLTLLANVDVVGVEGDDDALKWSELAVVCRFELLQTDISIEIVSF